MTFKQFTRIATFLALAALAAFSVAPDELSAQDSPRLQLERPPWLGVRMSEEPGPGVRIAGVANGSPAEKAGIRAGDLIVAVAGEPVKSAEHLQLLVRGRRAGDKLPLTIKRAGDRRSMTVALGATPTRAEVVSSHLVGRPAPTIRARLVAPRGAETSLEAFRGKPVVLEFWATWCSPCREMSKRLEALEEEHGDKLHVIGISAEPEKVIRDFLRDNGAHYVHLHDIGRSAHDAYFIDTFPTAMLIDAEGKVAAVAVGLDDLALFEKKIDRLVE